MAWAVDGSASDEDHVVPQQDIILEHRDHSLPTRLYSYPVYLCSAYVSILAIIFKTPGFNWRRPPEFTENGISFTPVQLAHAASAVGFAVALGTTAIGVSWRRNLVKRKVGICVLYVNGISFITYCFILAFGSPYIASEDATGSSEIEPIRYCQWLFTTPAIIYTVSAMLRRSNSLDNTRSYAIVSDAVMIVTGFLERYCGSPFHELFFMLSMVAFFFTMLHFKTLAEMGANALIEISDRNRFHRIHSFTVTVWTLFPVVRVLSILGASYTTEELLNTMLDVATKGVYVVCLMVIKFTVVDDLLEERLVKAEDYVRKDVAREAKKDESVLGCVDAFYSRKLLAYQEAECWRNVRVRGLRDEGFPAPQAEAILEATLKEYVALSCGDLSRFMVVQRGGSMDGRGSLDTRGGSLDTRG